MSVPDPDELYDAVICVFVSWRFCDVTFPVIVVSTPTNMFPVAFTFDPILILFDVVKLFSPYEACGPVNWITFDVAFAPAPALATSSKLNGDAETCKAPIVMLSAETLPVTVITLDPYVFMVRFDWPVGPAHAVGPIDTFAPSS